MSAPAISHQSSATGYTPIIGIEIHVELATKSKMFCGCVNDPFGAEKPNIYTCPVCLGMPGALPVANRQAVEWTIKIGQALGCKIALFSKFDRKHYFYPDLPKGYQISQYDQPLCYEGLVKTEFGDVRITRVHLEEDTGKLVHQEVDGKKVSLVDFNRSSVPLVEIVTEPDIKSAEHAKAYAKKIHQIIKYLHVSLADMEKGSMRLEANISVKATGNREQATEDLPPYKVEVKNLNSFRYIEKAILYEVARQTEILKTGEYPKQETRGWNDAKGETFPQRSKESAEDYRYFPDPDLPPMRFSQEYVDGIKASLPVLPDAVIADWISRGVKETEAAILSEYPAHVPFVNILWEEATKRGVDPCTVITQWVNKKITPTAIPLEADTQHQSAILYPIAKDLLDQSQALASHVQVSDDELIDIVRAVLEENPKAVADYRAGKQQVIGFLMGMVAKKSGKKIEASLLKEAITAKLA